MDVGTTGLHRVVGSRLVGQQVNARPCLKDSIKVQDRDREVREVVLDSFSFAAARQ